MKKILLIFILLVFCVTKLCPRVAAPLIDGLAFDTTQECGQPAPDCFDDSVDEQALLSEPRRLLSWAPTFFAEPLGDTHLVQAPPSLIFRPPEI